MDSKSLMIGDWVHYSINLGKDGIYEKDIQVTNIYGLEVNCEVEDYEIISGSRVCDLDPIPLTPEILEKNGFICHNKTDWCRGTACIDDIKFSIDGDVTILGVLFPRAITTVHELQHALRLCGLSYLADNFEIE